MTKDKSNIKKQFQSLSPEKRKQLLIWFLFFLISGTLFLGYTCHILWQDKRYEDTYWEEALQDDSALLKEIETISSDAVPVTAGTYVENIRALSIRENSFRLTFNLWFSWKGSPELDMIHHFRIYKGNIHNIEILENINSEDVNYQLARIDATISKDYWTVRFPLESYQLHFYIEPDRTADQVRIQADTENSLVLPVMTLNGFELSRSGVSVRTIKYDNLRNNPAATVPYTQELCTSIEINRDSFGLYLKCFIALLGTLIWIFITLFICTYHRIDPLRLIPTALFGAVTNIMVGANMLPDSMEAGLLEFVNTGGILIILAGTLSVVKINRIRSHDQDDTFAFIFGRTMFFTLLILTIIGAIAYPLAAYRF
ncbi:hypothetical protein [Frisingicoccus sp.]|uniref:hypothetical protein n=1 Tax=Frisingicoccus sp. TaxID=1918627 RepID=UPI002E786694|nr:hypothetical protein [Frisingicoccus sp.]MEE0752982.1 hypothetical protein [Frisingicoccus sp.]